MTRRASVGRRDVCIFAVRQKLWLQVRGALNGADLDVGLFAAFVEAKASNPHLAFAQHRSLRVDEESIVFLLQDDICDVLSHDAVVVGDEGFRALDHDGVVAGIDLDRVMNECGDASLIMAGNGLLQIGEQALDLDMVADKHVEGFVEVCGAGLGEAGHGGKQRAGE